MQCSLPGMLSLPICFAYILSLNLSISPFKKSLLDFLPLGNGSFFVSSSLPSYFTNTAVRMHIHYSLIDSSTHSFIHSFTYWFNHSFIFSFIHQQLLWVYCLLADVLGSGDKAVNKMDINPPFWTSLSLGLIPRKCSINHLT